MNAPRRLACLVSMSSHRPTREEFGDDVSTRAGVVLELRKISDGLRRLGLGVQADQIQRVVDAIETKRLLPALADLDHPLTHPTRETVRYIAENLTIAAEIIIELCEDAEITGSTDVVARANKFLETLGLIRTD